MTKPMRALGTGAGGCIGHHLVRFLKAKGYWVRGVDIKYPPFSPTTADEFLLLDLRDPENCRKAPSLALSASLEERCHVPCNALMPPAARRSE